MTKREVKRLKAEVKVKLSVLELAMISISLAHYATMIEVNDKDGKALLEAYEKLHKRLRKECQP